MNSPLTIVAISGGFENSFPSVFMALRACLYGAGLARVPGLARFAEISPPQKIPQHYLWCFILCLYESRASPVRRDPAFAYPRSWINGLIFLHVNSAARAGSRADIVHNINFKRALVHSLNFEAGWRRKRSRQADDCTKKKQFSSSLQGYFSHHYYFPL